METSPVMASTEELVGRIAYLTAKLNETLKQSVELAGLLYAKEAELAKIRSNPPSVVAMPGLPNIPSWLITIMIAGATAAASTVVGFYSFKAEVYQAVAEREREMAVYEVDGYPLSNRK